MLANAYWAFCDFMMSQTNSSETAFFWSKVLTFWPFLTVLIVHFSLVFTESDLLKNSLVYVVLYVPALFFSLIDLTTNWISVAPTLHPWGYATTYPSYSIFVRLDGIWSALLALFALFLFTSYYNKVTDKTRKQQTKFVALAFSIPIFVSLITDSIFVVAGFSFPPLGSIAGTVTSLFVLYAMIRYKLFSFRPEIAFDNIFSSMLDSIVLVDLEGVIVKVNRSLIELSGYGEAELIGKSISELINKANVSGVVEKTEQIVAGLVKVREHRNFEITFNSKTGQRRICLTSSSIIRDNRGQDVGLTVVLHDITENKEMEQRLIKAERLASIGDLAGILGHDLRNPLNAITVANYYLKNKYGNVLDKKDEVMFESIDNSINYSNKIVNDLIDYSCEIKLELRSCHSKILS